jgi:acyl-CoA-dependent ceramide synthase
MAGWMKWQIFTPILLLQYLNLFWYFFMWRILYRYVLFHAIQLSLDDSHRGNRTATGTALKDERSDDEGEDEDEDESSALKKKKDS